MLLKVLRRVLGGVIDTTDATCAQKTRHACQRQGMREEDTTYRAGRPPLEGAVVSGLDGLDWEMVSGRYGKEVSKKDAPGTY